MILAPLAAAVGLGLATALLARRAGSLAAVAGLLAAVGVGVGVGHAVGGGL